MKIPVSVIIAIKNEEKKIKECLEHLSEFDQVIVVDSQSRDKSVALSKEANCEIVDFAWNGQYPKKRQWCLDNLNLSHDWILFIDADEVVTPHFVEEIRKLFQETPSCCGYFVKASYVMNGKVLRFGLQNNKLVLFDRTKLEFPVIDDLDIPGMGEMEGHYQPVLKAGFEKEQIGQIKSPVLHDALDDEHAWVFRHKKYARWEIGMNQKNAWPKDPKPLRNFLKHVLRRSKYRPQLMFLISYVGLLGFLDGNKGLKFAIKKKQYYSLIQ